MGTCCNKSDESEVIQQTEYLKQASLNIVRRNYLGKPIGISKISFTNTVPINQRSQQELLGKKTVKITGCIVPGVDPRGEYEKECQDNYSFFYEDNTLLCSLYDGHGKEGLKVSNFCVEYTEKFFKKNWEKLKKNPEENLVKLLEKCDEKLRKSKINDEMSGSTAVLVYLNENSVYSASLGDSRGIISTLSDVLVETPQLNHKYYKSVIVRRNLKPVPLTIDQKPNHEDEYARIQRAGGVVEQVTDSFGKPIGPYRVWINGKDHPGLAMSRSIGDRIAKRIGVIATPVCHTFSLYDPDQFIVLASDGIWDVMENIEVINFVEYFKKTCVGLSSSYPAKPDNSSIARFLCEEARFRWYAILEAEDVMIDDISCIIIDFEHIPNLMKSPGVERNVKAFQSLAISSEITHSNNSLSINDEAK